jgi:hypothetical protein
VVGDFVWPGHGLAVVVVLVCDGVLWKELLEHLDQAAAMQHGAHAKVAATRGGVLVDEEVRGGDVSDVDVEVATALG